MKKVLKIIGIVFGCIIAFVLLILLFLGPIAKVVVQKYDEQIVGRQVEMSKLKINVLRGNARIYDFSIKETDETTDFVTFDTLDVSIRLLKLLKSEVNIPHITLAGPDIRITQHDTVFNFTDIIEHFASDSTKDKDTNSNWKVGLYNIRLTQGAICYEDEDRDKEWALNNLHLEVPGVYLDGESNTDAGISLTFANKGTLNTKVGYNIGNNDFEVKLKIDNFALENLLPYLSDFLAISELKGVFGGNIHIKGNLDEILNLDIDGTASVARLNVSDAKHQKVASMDRLDVDMERINPQQNSFVFNHIYINGFDSHYDCMADGSNNFSKLFVSNGNSDEKTEDTVSKADTDTSKMHLLVKDFKIENTRFAYNDYSMEEPFLFPVTNIRVKSENLQLEGVNRMNVMAALPGGGFANIQWKGTLDNIKTYQDLVINIKNLPMKCFSPYVVHYLAYPLEDGVFSFTSENVVKKSQLQGANKVDIYKLTVGDKRKEIKPEVKIPLKAAVYVLNDKDEKILLDVPVSGDLDNPEFSYMKLVWKTIGNLLVKVSVSPLRYLADAVGINGDDMEKMKIDPLQFDFTSEQYDLLSKLTELAKQDTNIIIQMEQQIHWDNAAHALSLYNVKRDYYLVQHPEKQNTRLQLVDFDKIKAINTKDLDFNTYLNDRVGESTEKKSADEKAEHLYPIAETGKEITAIAERRNQYIRYYMVKQLGLKDKQLEITNSEENATENIYHIQSTLREETDKTEVTEETE